MDKTGSSGDGDVRRPLVSLSTSYALAFVINLSCWWRCRRLSPERVRPEVSAFCRHSWDADTARDLCRHTYWKDLEAYTLPAGATVSARRCQRIQNWSLMGAMFQAAPWAAKRSCCR